MSPSSCLDGASRWWIHGQYPRYTSAVKDGRPWVAQATDKAAKHHRNATGTRSTPILSPQKTTRPADKTQSKYTARGAVEMTRVAEVYIIEFGHSRLHQVDRGFTRGVIIISDVM